jgi:hypothetical protein
LLLGAFFLLLLGLTVLLRMICLMFVFTCFAGVFDIALVFVARCIVAFDYVFWVIVFFPWGSYRVAGPGVQHP